MNLSGLYTRYFVVHGMIPGQFKHALEFSKKGEVLTLQTAFGLPPELLQSELPANLPQNLQDNARVKLENVHVRLVRLQFS